MRRMLVVEKGKMDKVEDVMTNSCQFITVAEVYLTVMADGIHVSQQAQQTMIQNRRTHGTKTSQPDGYTWY